MLRLVIITTAMLLSLLSVSANQIERTDTLFSASKAARIKLVFSPKHSSVTVKGIDGSAENYYYSTGISDKSKFVEQSLIDCTDVENISVVETETRVIVDFAVDGRAPMHYSYPLPDPENRYVNSYVGENNLGIGVPLVRKGNTKWDLVSGAFGFGWVAAVYGPKGMDVSMWSSNEFLWTMLVGVKMSHRNHSLTAGFGFDVKEFVTKGDRYFNKSEDGYINMVPYEEGMRKHSSRIRLFSLQIPVFYGFSFGKNRKFGIELGPVLNFNTGGNIKTTYKLEKKKYKVKTSAIGQRPVTVDFMGILRYKSIGVYAKYSPMSVLKSSAGIDFKGMSTGVMLTF